MTDTRELWEDRFDIYCEQNRIDRDATPNRWFAAREAFKDGYAWGLTDEHQKQISGRKENE